MVTKSTPGVYTRANAHGEISSIKGGGSYCDAGEIATAVAMLSNYGLHTGVVPGPRTITYDVGKGKFNYCQHSQEKLTVNPRVPAVSAYLVEQSNGTFCYTCACTGATEKPTVPPAISPLSIQDSWRAEAWQSLIPQLNNGLSLINFVYELKDFRLLAKTVRRLKSLALAFDPALFGSRTAAELTLSWSFAIKPMIDDIAKTLELCADIDGAINEFIAKGKQSNVYHFTKDIGKTQSVYKTTTHGRILDETQDTFSATLRCTYDYVKPPYWEGLRRVLGLRLTPEALWNAVPFSFLVDWVWKVNKALRQFDKDPRLTVYVTDYCDSLKQISKRSETYHRTGTVFAAQNRVACIGFEDEVQWCWERSQYLRVPGIPNTGYMFPVLDSLSNRELVLGGALLRTFI